MARDNFTVVLGQLAILSDNLTMAISNNDPNEIMNVLREIQIQTYYLALHISLAS